MAGADPAAAAGGRPREGGLTDINLGLTIWTIVLFAALRARADQARLEAAARHDRGAREAASASRWRARSRRQHRGAGAARPAQGSIEGKAPMGEVPYPDPNRLVGLLQDPFIRRILPASVREPVKLAPTVRTIDTFVPDGVHISTLKGSCPAFLGHVFGLRQRRVRTVRKRADRVVRAPQRLEIRRRRTPWFRRPPARGPRGANWSRDGSRPPRTRTRWLVDRDSFVSRRTVHDLVAADNSRWSWFAFRPPVEIGWLSIAAERMIELAWPMLLSGVILMALAARWA